jgi:uncharacterized membrane protein
LTFRTFVLWVHLSAIAVWLGGLFTVVFVLVPVVARRVASPKEVAGLVESVLKRFQRISREVIFLVFLSGIFNIMLAGMGRNFAFGATYMGLLTVKLVLFVTIIIVQAWQSMRLAPSFVATAEKTGADEFGPLAQGFRRRLYLSGLVSVALGITVIVLGLKLRYG